MKRTNKKRTNKKRTNKKRTRRNKRVQKSRRNKRVQKLKRTNGIRQMGGIVLTGEEEEDITSDQKYYEEFNDDTGGAKDLIFVDVIKSGSSGSVYQGILYPGTEEKKKVAIKLYNIDSIWYDSYLKFIETKDITFQKHDGGTDLKVNNTLKYGSVVHPPGGPVKKCSIMELYEGGDLWEEVKLSAGIALPDLKIYAGQILRQLIALHKVCGHGDIKPANIAIEIEGSGGADSKYVRLIDFDKFVGGTKGYKAPEIPMVISRSDSDPQCVLDKNAASYGWLQQCDMYSFGMTMLVSALPASQNRSLRGDWGGDVMIKSINQAFSGDPLFKSVIMNLLQGGDRSNAEQAYEMLFPSEEGTSLVPEPEPVKCGDPYCESLVSPDTLKKEGRILICENCYDIAHEYDDEPG